MVRINTNNFAGGRTYSKNTSDDIKEYGKPAVSNSKNELLNEAIENINAKYEPKFKVFTQKTNQQIAQKKDIEEIKGIATNLSSSIRSLSNFGSSMTTNLVANGLPAGIAIQTSGVVKAGSHTVQVQEIAQKQRILIQSVDGAGNPKPFALNPATDVTSDATGNFDVTTIYGANVNAPSAATPGTFARGFGFKIHTMSDNSDPGILIHIPGAATTLQGIADAINTAVTAAAAAIPGSDPILTAFIKSDNSGSTLVLESTKLGVDGNFYISDEDITGINNSGNSAFVGVVAADPMPHPSAISTLKILEQPPKSIDIYNNNGLMFSDQKQINGCEGTLSAFTWTIGKEGQAINFGVDDVKSISAMANRINKETAFTGISAQVIQSQNTNIGTEGGGAYVIAPGVGYILRVTSNTGSLNYTHNSLTDMYGGFMPSAMQVRATSACNTKVEIDGTSYDFGSGLTLNAPTSDIASITVSAKTKETNFSIVQDTEGLKKSIEKIVNSINSAQQIIAQKSAQGSRNPSELRSTLNGLSAIVNTLKVPVGTMNTAAMGMRWATYTPSSKEREAGLVPATYLTIDDKALQTALDTNLDNVKGFFTGQLTQVGSTQGSTVTLGSINGILQVPKFDLNVSKDMLGVITATASNYGVGGPVLLTYTPGANNTALITGQMGTIFSGLSMKYSIPVLGANLTDTSTISVYNGVSTILSNQMTSYFKSLENASTNVTKNLNKYDSDAQKVYEKRGAEIRKTQARAAQAKRQEEEAKRMQKLFEQMMKSQNHN